MDKRKVDLETASVEQIDKSLRAWRGIVVYTAFAYAAVAVIAFWVGSPIVGALMIVAGLVGVPWLWHYVGARHQRARARARSSA